MKILMVNRGIFPVPSDEGCGAEQHSFFLTNALAELGHEVHYVTNVSENARFRKNVIIHKLGIPALKQKANFSGYALSHFVGNTFAFKEAAYVLFQEGFDFDVIHCHGALSSLPISMIRNKVPLLFTIHDPTPYLCHYENSFERLIRKTHCRLIDMSIWRRANRIITVSKAIRNELVRWRISPEKIITIYNGVNTDFFRPAALTKNALDKYAIKNPYCLFVGRLTRRKGVHYLLKALVKTDVNCVIVGDGPERSDLISLAKKQGILNRVTFTGFIPVENLQKLYAGTEFFVFPSTADVGVTLTILEAMSSGLPAITADIPGASEVVLDGYNGFLVAPRDVEALTSKIQVLAKERETCKNMGNNARQFIVKNFSWRSIAEKTVEAYQKTILPAS